MGASGWQYVVAYEPDLNRALQNLRQREFEAGRYFNPYQFLTMGIEMGVLSAEQVQDLQPTLATLREAPAPSTIAQLQEQNAEEGTHSILDIELITEVPAFGTASPLKDQELLDVFGTLHPTLEKIIEKAKEGKLENFRGRWEGLYIIAYTKGTPTDIFFSGYSGD